MTIDNIPAAKKQKIDLDQELARILFYVENCGIDVLNDVERKLYDAYKSAQKHQSDTKQKGNHK